MLPCMVHPSNSKVQYSSWTSLLSFLESDTNTRALIRLTKSICLGDGLYKPFQVQTYLCQEPFIRCHIVIHDNRGADAAPSRLCDVLVVVFPR